MIGPNRFGNIPHIYGNFTHESNIVNAVDSFLDSVPSVLVGFGLGGEETALEAVLGVIVSSGEEHQSLAFGLARIPGVRTSGKVGQ